MLKQWIILVYAVGICSAYAKNKRNGETIAKNDMTYLPTFGATHPGSLLCPRIFKHLQLPLGTPFSSAQ